MTDLATARKELGFSQTRPVFLGKRETFICSNCGMTGNGNVEVGDNGILCFRCTDALVEAINRRDQRAISAMRDAGRNGRKSHQIHSGGANGRKNAETVQPYEEGQQ